jgi:glycosyltransferase involved in cell wall biosynthesis
MDSVNDALAPRYSICITTLNEARTLRASVSSIIKQIDGSYEIVVVDSMSSDGSRQILQQYASEGRIKLLFKKCSRGVGRQIAFENSTGEYVIANLDADEIFRPELPRLVEFYHRECEGNVVLAIRSSNEWSQNVTLGPRQVISKLGGWRNLQWGEDWDLWKRAAAENKFRWTVFPLVEAGTYRSETRLPSMKLVHRFGRYRDALRLGRSIFGPGERRSLSQYLIAIAARVSLPFYERYNEGPNSFNPYEGSLFVQFSEGNKLPT